MFNIKNQVNEAEITPSVYVLDISTDPPSIKEVKMAIAKLKNRKAADIGQISANLLKTEEVRTPIFLTNILQNIWESDEAPAFWKTCLS